MDAEELDRRLRDVEKQVKEDREHRHKHNASIAAVVDEVRLTQSNDQDKINEIKADMKIMVKEVRALVSVIEGNFGIGGIGATVQRHEKDISSLKAWRDSMKGYVAGWVASSAAITGIGVYILETVIK